MALDADELHLHDKMIVFLIIVFSQLWTQSTEFQRREGILSKNGDGESLLVFSLLLSLYAVLEYHKMDLLFICSVSSFGTFLYPI